MKKFSLCQIALISIIGLAAFFEIKDTMNGKKIFFLEKWIFSNRGYAKQIEIKTYILTDEQVVWLLNHPDEEVEQPLQKDLHRKNVNAVIRMKNRGKEQFWGLFTWETPNLRSHLVGIDNNASYKDKFMNFVFPMGRRIYVDYDESPEEITVAWVTLCTKK
ncbi:MAG: hypothetical protein HKM07_06330 [Chlamydiae bacterium]|nr:hypothetical protein [Chlamydiota bacterium]